MCIRDRHSHWVEEFLPKYEVVTEENVDEILKEEVGLVFEKVLEDAGVYKCTPKGRQAFKRFIESVKSVSYTHLAFLVAMSMKGETIDEITA